MDSCDLSLVTKPLLLAISRQEFPRQRGRPQGLTGARGYQVEASPQPCLLPRPCPSISSPSISLPLSLSLSFSLSLSLSIHVGSLGFLISAVVDCGMGKQHCSVASGKCTALLRVNLKSFYFWYWVLKKSLSLCLLFWANTSGKELCENWILHCPVSLNGCITLQSRALFLQTPKWMPGSPLRFLSK